MSIPMLLSFAVLIGAMFLMTRSAKKKQQQAATMRNTMEPGSGVRTIGGMYAMVKEVHDETVLLELADGVHAHYAKNAIGAVLDEAEYDRIVYGIEPSDDDLESVEAADDDAPVLEEADDTEDGRVDLTKGGAEDGSVESAEGDAKDARKTDGTDSK